MITRVQINGMSCQHCVRAVFTALAGVEGIVRAGVTIGAAEIEHAGEVAAERLAEAIRMAGYEMAAVETDRRRLPLI